jgi:hypothetical protein
MLSAYLANELPGVDPSRMALCLQMSDKALEAAEGGESDGSPIEFEPGIAPYTA